MKFMPTTVNQNVALALCAWACAPLPASALVINTAPVSFSNSASVADSEGGSATNNNGASLGTSTISQFDSNQGVLMGSAITLTSTRTQSTWVKSTDGPNNGNNNAVTSSGTGGSTANIAGPGLNSSFLPAINNNDTCTGSRLGGCSGTATTSATPTNLNQAVTPASLDSYVGNGNVLLERTAPTLSATQGLSAFTGSETTQHSVTWAGNVGATYDYLLHAAPSFDSSSSMFTLNLDFGTFYVGDVATLGFDIFNTGNADRVSLDLDSIFGTGDITKLLTNLGEFSGLAQGTGNNWLATFDTSAVGTFSASYSLSLSDADVGAASSRFAYNNYLTLNLTGTVDERVVPGQVNELPEPTTLFLMGLGLAGLGFSQRKKS